MRLKDRIVLITGASSGIGEATAHEVARVGGQPVLVARRQNELERVAGELERRYSVRARILAADLTEPDQRLRVRDFVAQELPGLDVLINNAGITAHGRFDETDLSVLRRTLDVNFLAPVELTALLLPFLKKSPGTKALVLVSTPSGLYGVPGRFAYSASKAAGHAWMETLRSELHAHSIRSILFCPGYTRTALRTSGLAGDGSVLQEEQAREAMPPEKVARLLRRAIEKEKRVVTTDFNGHVLYWLRTLSPGLLEWLMRKKLKKDFEKSAH